MCFNYWTPPTVLILLLVLHLFPNATAVPLLSRDQMLPSPPPPNCLLGPRPIFFPSPIIPTAPSSRHVSPRLNREVGDLNSSWVIMGGGSGAPSQTLGVAAPSTFSLHRFHLLTFRHQSAPLPPSCWDDHPPTHPRTHTHMHTRPCHASPLGGEIAATKPFCWPRRCYGNWAEMMHSGAEMFPVDTKCTDAFACWNVSQEVTRCVWSQLPAAVDHRAVSLKPLSLALALSLICCLWNKKYVRCLQR